MLDVGCGNGRKERRCKDEYCKGVVFMCWVLSRGFLKSLGQGGGDCVSWFTCVRLLSLSGAGSEIEVVVVAFYRDNVCC
jgi:hypothetical protein